MLQKNFALEELQRKSSLSTSITIESFLGSYNFYKVKIKKINEELGDSISQQLPIYLNLFLSDGRNIQTPCIDLNSSKNFFQVKISQRMDKIQIINYNDLNKICKLSLKGVNKDFKISHEVISKNLMVQISNKQICPPYKSNNSYNEVLLIPNKTQAQTVKHNISLN